LCTVCRLFPNFAFLAQFPAYKFGILPEFRCVCQILKYRKNRCSWDGWDWDTNWKAKIGIGWDASHPIYIPDKYRKQIMTSLWSIFVISIKNSELYSMVDLDQNVPPISTNMDDNFDYSSPAAFMRNLRVRVSRLNFNCFLNAFFSAN